MATVLLFLCLAYVLFAGVGGCWIYTKYRELDFSSLSEDKKKEYAAFERKDIKRVSIWKALLGVFLLFPLKIMIVVPSISSTVLFVAFTELVKKLAPNRSEVIFSFQKRMLRGVFRFGLYVFGVWTIKEHFPEGFYRTSPRCVISNHVSILDILFFGWSLFSSFVAKKGLQHSFIIAPSAKIMQCIFVDRESEEGRQDALGAIVRRQRDKTMRPPLVIFAEGTTSNGRSLLPFKKGGFTSMTEVHPVVLVYRISSFDVSFELIPTTWWLVIVCSSFGFVRLDVYWLPPVRPQGDLEAFMKEVHDKMAAVLKAKHPSPIQQTNTKMYSDTQTSLRLKRECVRALLGEEKARQYF